MVHSLVQFLMLQPRHPIFVSSSGVINPIRSCSNDTPQKWWFAEVVADLFIGLYAFESNPSLMHTIGMSFSS